LEKQIGMSLFPSSPPPPKGYSHSNRYSDWEREIQGKEAALLCSYERKAMTKDEWSGFGGTFQVMHKELLAVSILQVQL
jgi:hypothetical protein